MEPAEYDLMDAAEQRMWWYRALHARVIGALRRRPGPAGTVLDAGCGTGGLLARMASLGRPLAGLDFNPAAARARRPSPARWSRPGMPTACPSPMAPSPR